MALRTTESQSAPATPSAAQVREWPDHRTLVVMAKDANGIVRGADHNASVAQQTGFAADTYLTDSAIRIPSSGVRAKTVFQWEIIVTKTAAGTAAPVFQVRIGTAGTTADASRLSITTAAQTAAADTAKITVTVTVRNVGAGGVIRGHVHIQHNLAATGFANTPAGFNLVEGSSAAFDNSALDNNLIGLSINGGASAAWTIEQVLATARF